MLRSCLLVTLPALVVCAGEVREEILVVVNGHIITRRVFQQAVEQEAAALYRQFSGKILDEKLRDTREKTLQGLIDSFVLEDKSAELGILITDDYLSEMVEGIKKENKFQSDADFEQALRASLGIGLGEYLKRSRRQMIQQEVLRREVFSRVAVEDQELRAYYEDHKDEYRQPSRFRIRELVLPRGATPEEQQAARTKVQEIQAALKAGKTFEDLVKLHSASPTRSLGGDLGLDHQGSADPRHRRRRLGPQGGPGLGAHRDRQGYPPGPAHRRRPGCREALCRGEGADPGKAPGTQGPERHPNLFEWSPGPGEHPLHGPQGPDSEGLNLRLDLFLKKTHLLKRRELARELCDEGVVRVNGIPRKASFELKIGDELLFPVYNRILRVRVLDIPAGSVPKTSQWSMVEILEEKRLPVDFGPGEDPTIPRPKTPTEH